MSLLSASRPKFENSERSVAQAGDKPRWLQWYKEGKGRRLVVAFHSLVHRVNIYALERADAFGTRRMLYQFESLAKCACHAISDRTLADSESNWFLLLSFRKNTNNKTVLLSERPVEFFKNLMMKRAKKEKVMRTLVVALKWDLRLSMYLRGCVKK